MIPALMIVFFPVFLIPLVASRGVLSRGHWFAFSLALIMLSVFIVLRDPAMTGAIAFSLLESGRTVRPSVALISGAYLLPVGCALGCLVGGLVYRGKKAD
jgi:hypothetical protein